MPCDGAAPQTAATGEALLPAPATLDGALLIVRLRDASLAGARAPLLGLWRRVVSGTAIRRLPFRLRVRRPGREGGDLVLEAELRWQAGRRLAPGDLLSLQHTPWRGCGPVVVPVERVR